MLRAGEAPARLTPGSVVRELLEVLGAAIVSGIGGVRNARSIYQWLSGERQPEKLQNLRFALQIVYVMRAAGESDQTISAWFTSVNVRLKDATPASLLSTNTVTDIGASLMGAVRAFLEPTAGEEQ
ncbi:MAG TPA: hypothetical protein VGF98_01990 [Candidatus Tumulicola sp.]